jgi:hypothetical protein
MPVRQIAPARSSEHHTLVDELAAEWGAAQSANAEPVILEERERGGRLVHVYVVWSKWRHMDRVERSEIIMEAAEKHLPQDQVLNVSIAMGLTPDEASRFGLKY